MPSIGDQVTTNKMDFTTDWLLESISIDGESNNYSLDVKIGTKRATTAVNCDQRRIIPKKRRKQTNPTRISSNEENPSAMNDKCSEYGVTLLFSPNANENELLKRNSSEPVKDKIKLTSRQHVPLNSSAINLTKSDCAQKCTPNESKNSLNYQNVEQLLQNDSASDVSSKCVISSHHSLAKTIPYAEKKDNHPVVDHALGYVVPPVKHDNLQSPAAVVRTSAVPVQIFNPEAFCNQCNKEFCNKYFLKTHKANKHGVYTDNGYPNGSIEDQHEKSNKISFAPIAVDFPPNDCSRGKSPLISLAFNGVPAQPTAAVVGNTNASKDTASPQNRAFCNICQKEFCNKYFVKRHKAKIHGFTVDDRNFCKNDHVIPLNFKMSGEFKKNYVTEAGIPGAGIPDKYDKNYKITMGPSADVCKTESEISKNTRPKAFVKSVEQIPARNETIAIQTKALIVESTSDHNIKVERLDEHCVNKVTYGSTTNDSGDKGEIVNNNLNHDINATAFYGQSVREQLAKSYVEDRPLQQQQSIEELGNDASNSTPMNLITVNNNGGHFSDNPVTDYGKGQKNDKHEHTKIVNIVENNDGMTIKTNRTVEVDKNRLLTFHNLIFQLNENSLENVSKCYLCDAPVADGSLKTHIFDKHKNLISELMNETLDLCNNSSTNTRTEYPCHNCRLTFDSDALLKAHFDQWDCGDNGCRASTASSVENDEQFGPQQPFFGDPGETKHYAIFSSFCKICNKELCNKYFMKTHMRRMHGISIKNDNNIGGVMCDICNKELCSKYFLRVHKQNSHGVVDSSGPTTKIGLPMDTTTAPVNGTGGCGSQTSAEEAEVGNNRYYRHYTEVCGVCFRRFRSSKWLGAHLLNEHGEDGKAQWTQIQNHHATIVEHNEKHKMTTVVYPTTIHETNESGSAMPNNGNLPQLKENSTSPQPLRPTIEEMKRYRCSYCTFTTSVLSFLFVHEKFHLTEKKNALEDTNAASLTPLTCSVCCAQFPDTTQLENHLILWHFNNNNNKNNYTGTSSPPGTSWAPVSQRSPEVNFTNGIADVKSTRSAADYYNVNTLDVDGNDVFVAELGSSTAKQPLSPAPWVRNSINVDVPLRPDYYVPKQEPFIMQSFFLENSSASPSIEKELRKAGRSDPFHPSLVYLPVKEKLTSTVNVFFKLTPT